MVRCNIGYTPQNCWAINTINVEERLRQYYKEYDLLQYTLGAVNYYNGINKIPKNKIPEYEKYYFIIREEYFGVKYLILRLRPGANPPPFPK